MTVVELRAFSRLMHKIIADIAGDPDAPRVAMEQVHLELAQKNRAMASRIDRGEAIPFEELIALEQVVMHAAWANLLCEAHASSDPLVFAEAQMRVEAIAGVLDRIPDAYSQGNPARLQELQDEVGDALASLAELVHDRT
jgi:hypothetical protein